MLCSCYVLAMSLYVCTFWLCLFALRILCQCLHLVTLFATITRRRSYVMFPAECMPSMRLDFLVLAMSICTEDTISVLAPCDIIITHRCCYVMFPLCSGYSVCMYILAMAFCVEDTLSVLAPGDIVCTYNTQM